MSEDVEMSIRVDEQRKIAASDAFWKEAFQKERAQLLAVARAAKEFVDKTPLQSMTKTAALRAYALSAALSALAPNVLEER